MYAEVAVCIVIEEFAYRCEQKLDIDVVACTTDDVVDTKLDVRDAVVEELSG